LWDFFRKLFHISFSSIFELFAINEDFQSYSNAVTDALTALTPFQGCETYVDDFKTTKAAALAVAVWFMIL